VPASIYLPIRQLFDALAGRSLPSVCAYLLFCRGAEMLILLHPERRLRANSLIFLSLTGFINGGPFYWESGG